MGEHGTFCSHGYYFGERYQADERFIQVPIFLSFSLPQGQQSGKRIPVTGIKNAAKFPERKERKKFLRIILANWV